MKKFLDKYESIHSSEFDMVHITSDMHFRHDKIHEFEPIREQLRIEAGFDGTPDEFLIHTWNSQVGKKDLVVNLGDLHWKSLEPIADKLNGVMLLVLGNHDNKPQYYEKFPNIYVVEGVWDLNGIPTQYYIKDQYKLLSAFIYNNVIYSHYPVYSIGHEYNYQRRSPNKIIERMELLFEIAMNEYKTPLFNVHGHLHSSLPEGEKRSANVCIDFNKYNILGFNEVHNEVRKEK